MTFADVERFLKQSDCKLTIAYTGRKWLTVISRNNFAVTNAEHETLSKAVEIAIYSLPPG